MDESKIPQTCQHTLPWRLTSCINMTLSALVASTILPGMKLDISLVRIGQAAAYVSNGFVRNVSLSEA